VAIRAAATKSKERPLTFLYTYVQRRYRDSCSAEPGVIGAPARMPAF